MVMAWSKMVMVDVDVNGIMIVVKMDGRRVPRPAHCNRSQLE